TRPRPSPPIPTRSRRPRHDPPPDTNLPRAHRAWLPRLARARGLHLLPRGRSGPEERPRGLGGVLAPVAALRAQRRPALAAHAGREAAAQVPHRHAGGHLVLELPPR